ncbi:MAG: EthD family reductase [Cytophagales bacterium]|nr:EthD family reductase [Cytophagales bacterium]
MIKFSVYYPNSEGAKFDAKYYCGTHFSMVKAHFGSLLENVTFEEPLSDEKLGVQAKYIGIGNMYFRTYEDLEKLMADPFAVEMQKDAVNYTNVVPEVVITRLS